MKSLSKIFYISSFLAGSIFPAPFIGLGQYLRGNESIFLIVIGIAFFVLLLFVILSLTYEMWSSIEDIHARMSPGKAVGFLFIPLYNIYWMYQVLVGFVEDYNDFISRNEIKTPILEDGVFKIFFFLTLISLVPYIGGFAALANLVVGAIMISKICDAVNAVNFVLYLRAE